MTNLKIRKRCNEEEICMCFISPPWVTRTFCYATLAALVCAQNTVTFYPNCLKSCNFSVFLCIVKPPNLQITNFYEKQQQKHHRRHHSQIKSMRQKIINSNLCAHPLVDGLRYHGSVGYWGCFVCCKWGINEVLLMQFCWWSRRIHKAKANTL